MAADGRRAERQGSPLAGKLVGRLRATREQAERMTAAIVPAPGIPRKGPLWGSTYWLFNLGAEVYAWFTSSAAWRASCARLAARLADLDSAWIADLGCGPGVSTFQLARQLPTARLVGLDLAPRMLREARRAASRESARITWVQADAASLPFQKASLDACTGHSFLYLVANRAGVLSEVRRVLRPGGRLVLMEPNDEPATVARTLRVSRDPRHLCPRFDAVAVVLHDVVRHPDGVAEAGRGLDERVRGDLQVKVGTLGRDQPVATLQPTPRSLHNRHAERDAGSLGLRQVPRGGHLWRPRPPGSG